MYVSAAIDPMSMILSEKAYLIWVELKHPHVPSVSEVQKALQNATAEEKSTMLHRAQTVAAHAKAVEQALRALK